MTGGEFYKTVRKAKKKMIKLGANPKVVRISYGFYKELTGRRDIPCGKIDGMDMIVDFSIDGEAIVEGGKND